MKLDPKAIARAASLLVAARKSRTPLQRLPEDCRPATVDDALRIQAASVEQLGERVAGWKVGGRIDGALTYGVLLSSRIVPTAGRASARDMPLLGIEAEIAFRFVRALPPRDAPYGYDEVADNVAALPAIEIVATRYVDYAGTPVIERLADCMSNGAFVAGAPRTDWRSFDLVKPTVTLAFDGKTIVEKVGGHNAGDPLLPAVELVNALRATTGVEAGQLMTTGTYTGLTYAKPGQHVRASFRDFGSTDVGIAA